MTNWIYNEQTVTEEMTEGQYGFVYCITNITNNKKYIGRKYFTKAATRQVKGKKKKTRVSSGWQSYYGSNKNLQQDVKTLGEENFTREILHFCVSRSHCSYMETYEIFNRNCLLKEEYYNDWVTCKISKSHLKAAPILIKERN